MSKEVLEAILGRILFLPPLHSYALKNNKKEKKGKKMNKEDLKQISDLIDKKINKRDEIGVKSELNGILCKLVGSIFGYCRTYTPIHRHTEEPTKLKNEAREKILELFNYKNNNK